MQSSVLPAGNLQHLIGAINNASTGYDTNTAPAATVQKFQIMGACKALLGALADPQDLVGMHYGNMMEVVAIRTLLDLKAFNAMPETGSISAREIATQIGAQEGLIERLLRIVVATGIVLQLPDLTYQHTKFSKAYTIDPGPGLVFSLLYDEVFLQISRLHRYLREKGLHEPLDQNYSPYAWNENAEGQPIWKTMMSHPTRFDAFQRGLPLLDAGIPIVGYFDFGQFAPKSGEQDRMILVDVGGGQGQSIIAIHRLHPELPLDKFVLQDLPPVLEMADRDGLLPKEVHRMAHDFNTLQPVKNAKAYYFRRVLHDYSDPVCIEMLKQIVPAMGPDSRVLVSDFIVPAQITPADLPVAAMSVGMFQMAGKERNEKQFAEIFEAAGLELVNVHLAAFGSIGLVEARLKQ